jgi:hypothetical protein
MPSKAELPEGPVRDFVTQLFALYREAHRPPLREISQEASRSDCRGTASPETIRRMLRGVTISTHWPAVEAVLIALCNLAGTSPDQPMYRNDYGTRREELESAWHRALDAPDERPRQPAGFSGQSGGFSDEPPHDPWASSKYSEEPPF